MPTELHEGVGREPEWLVTNGIGGFASGTVLGIHRRRYHALLIASFKPPVQRRLLWAKNDEWLLFSDGRIPLGANDYGDVIQPDGWRHIHSFHLYPFPTTVFFARGVALERTVFMVQGQNTTIVLYRMVSGNANFQLHIDPFTNYRDYHHTARAGSGFLQRCWDTGTALQIGDDGAEFVLGAACAGGDGGPAQNSPSDLNVPRLRYVSQPDWHYNFHYAIERQRGLDDREDHFRPGFFRWRPRGPGDTLALIGHCATREQGSHPPWRRGGAGLFRWAMKQYDDEVTRRVRLLIDYGQRVRHQPSPVESRLVLAADAFVAHRQTTGATTILAGYPWFTDWGRDAMISLPGLLLVPGRFEEAREVLLTFATHRADGLIPNRFPDDGGEPLYNTVDASLWFIWAAWQFARASADDATMRRELLPVMEDIVAHYIRGTRHGIGVDGDGLVQAADAGLQLTWMDAKAGDWVVTPRAGVPVEINALWYNALRTVATLARRYDVGSDIDYASMARKVRRAFLRRFVRREGGLWDVVTPVRSDIKGSRDIERGEVSFRSNQIFAAALPFPVLSGPSARTTVQQVARHLFTPVGLRTLAPEDPAYVGQYGGDQWQRDGAYHQGTVWPWLFGAFVDAGRRTGVVGDPDSTELVFNALDAHMRQEGALGHVSEIFAGDPPHGARGCFAQAWSVAEGLRVFRRNV